MNALEFLDRLVAFDTTSAKPNRALVDFVADWLRQHGAEPVILPDETGDKANLWVSFGPKGGGGICLSGHTDVVPADPKEWQTDPFTLVRKGTRLYGRGTSDMKGFVAAVLSLVPQMAQARLTQPLHIALSYDEEVGCTGVRPMVEEIGRSLPRPDIVLVGEPSGMKVVTGHKGLYCFRTVVTGKEAHSSQTHRGVSAVMIAGRLVAELDRRAKQHMAASTRADADYDPPFSSIHIGRIDGGTAFNIISRSCEFSCDIRNLPGEDAGDICRAFTDWFEAEVLPEMHALDPATGIEIFPGAHVPAMSTAAGSAAETLMRSITGDNGTTKVEFCTEAGVFQAAGLDAVICGPGSIDVAHRPDEYIDESQIAHCVDALSEVIRRCL